MKTPLTNQYRFDGQNVINLPNDSAAFDHAVALQRGHEAIVEKLIDGIWCPFSDPVSDVIGWVTPEGMVVATDENDDPVTISALQYISVAVNHLEHLRQRFAFGKVLAKDAPEILQDLHTILVAIKKID